MKRKSFRGKCRKKYDWNQPNHIREADRERWFDSAGMGSPSVREGGVGVKGSGSGVKGGGGATAAWWWLAVVVERSLWKVER